jgi:D-inositol-3-phosphate glycosyltransferase
MISCAPVERSTRYSIDGETGRLVAPGDDRALADALLAYLRDPELRRQDGQRARKRAVDRFARERVWANIRLAYDELVR